MTSKLLSHNMGVSSKLLADALGIKRLHMRRGIWRPRPRDNIINWGAGVVPARLRGDCNWINHPDQTRVVSNKLTFFREYADDAGFNVPPYFFSRHDAESYLRSNPRSSIVCRTLVSSHEGRGIVIADTVDDLVDAPLYTAYVKKRNEYRVHVMCGDVIDAVEKKRRRGHEGIDSRVRNTANGYVFCRTGVEVPRCVTEAASNALAFYQLDFAAFDVIYNAHYDKAYVLEANTAPGIEGTTVQRYAAGLRRYYNV